MRRIRLLTVAFGERYLDLFHRACLRSLWQPGNLPALLREGREIEHLVVTPCESVRSVPISLVCNCPPNYNIKTVWYGDRPNIQVHAIGEWLKMCVGDGSLAMIANPDWFYADGSVTNMVNYLQDRDFAVAGLYARVNDGSFLKELDECSNDTYRPYDLVDAAMLSHAHHCLEYADVSRDRNSSAYSGVFIQPIADGLWSMNMRLAHVFLASINSSDVDNYNRCKDKYGQEWWNSSSAAWWDSLWPSHLYEQGRLKFLESSDLFFCVDLTKPDMGNCKVVSNILFNDDCLCDGRCDPHSGHKARLHPEACKSFVGVLRGTQCK
jgi:hypothetical protein